MEFKFYNALCSAQVRFDNTNCRLGIILCLWGSASEHFSSAMLPCMQALFSFKLLLFCSILTNKVWVSTWGKCLYLDGIQDCNMTLCLIKFSISKNCTLLHLYELTVRKICYLTGRMIFKNLTSVLWFHYIRGASTYCYLV